MLSVIYMAATEGQLGVKAMESISPQGLRLRLSEGSGQVSGSEVPGNVRKRIHGDFLCLPVASI